MHLEIENFLYKDAAEWVLFVISEEITANSLKVKMQYWCKSEQSCIPCLFSDWLKSCIASCLIYLLHQKLSYPWTGSWVCISNIVILSPAVLLGWLEWSEKPDPKPLAKMVNHAVKSYSLKKIWFWFCFSCRPLEGKYSCGAKAGNSVDDRGEKNFSSTGNLS